MAQDAFVSAYFAEKFWAFTIHISLFYLTHYATYEVLNCFNYTRSLETMVGWIEGW